MIHPGLSELEVAGILEKALRDEGGEEAPFPPIAQRPAHGRRCHAGRPEESSRRGLRPPGFRRAVRRLLFGRHTYDRGRCGERRAARECTRSCVRRIASSSSVRAGMTGMAADTLARSYIGQRDHGAAFGHSLGHGLGLEVHEAPRLARTAETALKVGAVVTIEPGIPWRGGRRPYRGRSPLGRGPNDPHGLFP